MGRAVDLTGMKFGKLTVVAKLKRRSETGKVRWRCECECGNERRTIAQTIKKVGHCGCGNATCHTTHGLTYHPLFQTHRHMIDRCENPEYPNYHGRGITVCKAWKDMRNFVEWAEANGYAQGLELDRRNNAKGYNPNNCRFVTRSINNRNKRNNRMCRYRGKKRLFIEVWEMIGKGIVSYDTACRRYFVNDWELEQALTTPARPMAEKRSSTR